MAVYKRNELEPTATLLTMTARTRTAQIRFLDSRAQLRFLVLFHIFCKVVVGIFPTVELPP